jgi:hypothetical protein
MDANAEARQPHGQPRKPRLQQDSYVLQLNKRDRPNVLSVDAPSSPENEPLIEAIAFQGPGVFETLKEIARQVLTDLKQGG